MSDRNVKCPRCKSYRFEIDFLKEGRRLKTCIRCREYTKRYRQENDIAKCIHNRQKSQCVECKGKGICEHNRIRYKCVECKGTAICQHNRRKYRCVQCQGSQICEHKTRRSDCRKCSDPVKISIQKWISTSKQTDKKYNRYDADRFIDCCFLKELVKDYTKCYYCDVELQYLEYNDTLATIERLNNSIGHIKSNCVLACRKCNFTLVGQQN